MTRTSINSDLNVEIRKKTPIRKRDSFRSRAESSLGYVPPNLDLKIALPNISSKY